MADGREVGEGEALAGEGGEGAGSEAWPRPRLP